MMPNRRRSRRKPPQRHEANLNTPGNGQTNLDKWLASGNDPVPPVVEEPFELGVEHEIEGGNVLMEKQQVEKNPVLQAQKLIRDAIEKSRGEQDQAIFGSCIHIILERVSCKP